jgi:adenosine deaminase
VCILKVRESWALMAHACNPATQAAEIRRIEVQSQPGQIVRKTLSQKNSSQQRGGGVAQGVDPVQAPVLKKQKKSHGKSLTTFQTDSNSYVGGI